MRNNTTFRRKVSRTRPPGVPPTSGEIDELPARTAVSRPTTTFASARAAARQAVGEAPRQATFIGRTLGGKYRVLEEIGSGSMGTVFRAEQIALKKPVALKVLRQDLELADESLRRFPARGHRRRSGQPPERDPDLRLRPGRGRRFLLGDGAGRRPEPEVLAGAARPARPRGRGRAGAPAAQHPGRGPRPTASCTAISSRRT